MASSSSAAQAAADTREQWRRIRTAHDRMFAMRSARRLRGVDPGVGPL
ncbi:hypothetical protein C7S14_5514 [Burkholderia cepacia]|nr:hypothetical protein C7S14_5514 [Burkholderia cepacia]